MHRGLDSGRRRPDLARAFRVPAVPFVSTAGVIVCGAMIYGLGWTNWLRFVVWLVIGLVVYFSYGRKHSEVQALETKPSPRRPWQNRIQIVSRGLPECAEGLFVL